MSARAVIFVLWTLLLGVALGQSSAPSEIASMDDFEYDENDRLVSHQLLYHGNEECESNLLSVPYERREVKRLADPLLHQYIATSNQNNSNMNCFLICLERGVHYNHVLYPLLDQVLATNDVNKDLQEWIGRHCQAKEVGFISYLPYEAHIFWISHTGQRVQVGSIQAGEHNTVWMGSYLGHTFIIVNPSNEEIVGQVTIEYHTLYTFGEQISARRNRDVRHQVRDTLGAEWQRAHRVTRTFTEFGFNKGKLPKDLFGSMSAYYYNNRDQATMEEWESKGVFVNWWEQDVFFVSMPFGLKRYWQSRLKKLVEAWVGIPLELTDIYGMRRYEDGARLLTHVDREKTHACSLIVNIAQGEIREPWKIEIYDHADRLHEVDMEEGDIVYYESARCLHGRMQPLQGAYYVNLFAHYRPVGDDEWFLKPNPPDGTPPALDIGHCHSNGTAAKCDGDYHVPFLSPRLEQLKGAEDLYKFWEEVGQPGYSSVEPRGLSSPSSSNAEEL